MYPWLAIARLSRCPSRSYRDAGEVHAIINGGFIRGDRTYADRALLSKADLMEEMPFPKLPVRNSCGVLHASATIILWNRYTSCSFNYITWFSYTDNVCSGQIKYWEQLSVFKKYQKPKNKMDMSRNYQNINVYFSRNSGFPKSHRFFIKINEWCLENPSFSATFFTILS